jgi:hypothetical protein
MPHKDDAVKINKSSMFRVAAEPIGCLLAPVPIVGVGLVELIFHTSFDAFAIIIFSLVVYLLAFGFTIVLGYPIYRLLLRLKAFRWWTSILLGAVIGAVVTIMVGHPISLMSDGVLINSAASAGSGLLFWAVQQGKWGKENLVSK